MPKTTTVLNKPANNLNSTNTCMISKKNFESINNLYRFNKIKDLNCKYYYNKKRNSYVIKESYDKMLKNTVFYIDKNWFKQELYATNSETLLQVGDTTPELFYITNTYKEMKAKEKCRHGSLIDNVEKRLDELLKLY